MKILHVHTRYRNPGGEDTVVDGERRLLSDSGFEVVPVDFHNPHSSLDAIMALAQAPWNRSASDRVVDEATKEGVDLVHIHNTWFALSPAVVPKLRRVGIPVVMTFHNYRLVCVNAMLFRDGLPCETCVGGSTLPGIKYRCYRGSLGASAMASATIELHRRQKTWMEDLSVAIVLTEFTKSRLLQGGLPPNRTVIKPNFVSDPGSRLLPPSQSSEVLFVGRLSIEKGIDRLVEAWEHAELSGLDLNIIGSGPLASKLGKVASGATRYLGHLPPAEVMARMLRARALVVPSIGYEAQPMVILEALAAGLPVLHTDVGALGETCGPGGVSMGSGDVSQMTAGLRVLLQAESLDTMGSHGREEFEQRFTEARSLRNLEAIYQTALTSDVSGRR